MTNIAIRDAGGIPVKYLKAGGVGTEADPYIPSQSLSDSTGNTYNINNPFPTPNGSVYFNELDIPFCTVTGWEIDGNTNKEDVLKSLLSGIQISTENNTATNPKIIDLQFQRPIKTRFSGVNAPTGERIKNTKIELHRMNTIVHTYDNSADSTDREIEINTNTFELINRIRFKFYTDDPVQVGFVGIFKTQDVSAEIQGSDSNGIPRTALLTSTGRQEVSSVADAVEIAREERPGYAKIEKFGQIDAAIVQSTGAEDVWSVGGRWVAPATNGIHTIKSTSDLDTALGTGARTVNIDGIEWGTWAEVSETVIMDGQNEVDLANDYAVIHRKEVMTSGTNNTNVGDIDSEATADATITAQIPAGKGKTLMAVFGVPAGKELFVEQCYGYLNSSGAPAAFPQAVMELRVLKNADVADRTDVVEHKWGASARGSSAVPHEFKALKKIGEKSIIYVNLSEMTEISDMSAGFDGYVVDITA